MSLIGHTQNGPRSAASSFLDRARARPCLLAAVGLVTLWAGASLVLALWYTGRIRDWSVMTDELQYAKLATSIGESGSPLPSIHGTAVSISNQLYPLLIAPFYGALSTPSAFRAAHVLNAIVMASAVVPAYLLGRQVLSRPWALGAAALSVSALWMVLAGFVMSEAAAYPAFLWALLGLQLAIVSPSVRNDLLAVGAVALAFLARAQFAVLALVLLLAVLGHEVGRALASGEGPWWMRVLTGARAAVERHVVLAGIYAVGAVVAIAAALSDSVGGLLGAYSVTLEEGSILPFDTWPSAARHIDTIAIGAGFVPLVLGGGWMLAALYRSRSDRERALATLFLLTVVLLTIETASYNVRFGGPEIIRDRYLFYVVPLLLIGMAAALSATPRKPLAIAAACIVVFFAATALALDLEPFAGLNVDSPVSILYDRLGDLAGGIGTEAFVALAALVLGGALVLGVLFAPRLPFAVTLFLLLAVFSTGALYAAGDRVLGSDGPSGRPMAEPPGVVLDWLDSVIPDDAEAGLVAFPVSTDWHLSAIRWWDTEFWNRSVTRAYVLPDGTFTYTPFPAEELEIDWATGEVPGTTDAPAFVVRAPNDPRFGLRGSSHAQNAGLEVLAVERPYRALWATRGLDVDGWTGRGSPVTLRLYGGSKEPAEMVELDLTVQAPPGTPAILRIEAPDTAEAVPLFAGEAKNQRIQVCVPANSTTDVVVTGWSNARIPAPPTGPEVVGTRAVGVGITGVGVEPTGVDCEAPLPE
jgi:hypothetical protein